MTKKLEGLPYLYRERLPEVLASCNFIMLAFPRLTAGRLRNEMSRHQGSRNLVRQLCSRLCFSRHVFGLYMYMANGDDEGIAFSDL